LTNTAVTSAVPNFRYHKLTAKLSKRKNSDKNFYLQSVWEKLAILNAENIKICE